MSRLKPLILFVLLGLGYPISVIGWSREEVLESVWGPLHVLWAFALGFGAFAMILGGGRGAKGAFRAVLSVGLLSGYGASGMLAAAGASPGGPWRPLAVLWGAGVLAAVWTHSMRSVSTAPQPARA
jgi:hypothetical protein